MGTSATQNRPSPASFLTYEVCRRRFTNIKKHPEISPARPPKVPIKCGNLFYGDLRRREKWSSKIYKTRKISKKYFPRDLQSPHKMWKPVLWGPPAHFRDSSWRHSVAGPSAQGPRPRALGPGPSAQGPRPRGFGPQPRPRSSGPEFPPGGPGPETPAQRPRPRGCGPGAPAQGARPRGRGPEVWFRRFSLIFVNFY